MSSYVGAECPSCKEKFKKNDDIVVCPTCGTPYHRDCYKKEGHCVFESEHASGKVWKRAQTVQRPSYNANVQSQGYSAPFPNYVQGSGIKTPPYTPQVPLNQGNDKYRPPNMGTNPQSTEIVCPACGKRNSSSNLFCNQCGFWLAQSTNTNQGYDNGFGGVANFYMQSQFDPKFALYGGVSPEDKIGDFSASEVATFVGSSSSYYLPQFKEISDNDKKITFNISSMLFGFLYFFYRKMYVIGAVLLALFVISSVPTVQNVNEQMKYMAHVAEVGVDEYGNPNEEYDTAAMARMKHYANVSNQTTLVYMLVVATISLLATRMYYNNTMKKMTKTLEPFGGTAKKQGKCIACEGELRKKGGTNKAVVIITIVGVYFGYTAFMLLRLFL